MCEIKSHQLYTQKHKKQMGQKQSAEEVKKEPSTIIIYEREYEHEPRFIKHHRFYDDWYNWGYPNMWWNRRPSYHPRPAPRPHPRPAPGPRPGPHRR